MADRIGKLCDDCQKCGEEKVIGLCSCPVMYMVVGTFESGYIEDDVVLPRFGWEIFADYHEDTDRLVQLNLTRVELCGCCWVKRLSRPKALEEVTGAQYCVERRAAYWKANPAAAKAKAEREAAAEAEVERVEAHRVAVARAAAMAELEKEAYAEARERVALEAATEESTEGGDDGTEDQGDG
ncbi:hypothetical protein LCGC14_0447000 [marine sediment metagenome]|uniref:Uncharacterized protein n=1 Tax=marine sediment metagenome TaxID=412755 RepID=A0A0F9SPR3_9ZZZZ